MTGPLVLTAFGVSLVWLAAGATLVRTPRQWPGGVCAILAGLSGVGAVASDSDLLVVAAVLGWGPLTVVLSPAGPRR